MASKTCMNELCRTTMSPQWKKGWGLKSGRFATLCYNCGYAYETLVFCETFHLEESGWRDCRICGKRIHCGCIASRYLHDYLEFGGVACITCAKHMETQSMRPILIPGDDIPNGFSSLRTIDSCKPKCSVVENRVSASPLENGRIIRLCKSNGANEPGNLFHSQKGDTDTSSGQLKQEKNVLPHGEVSRGFSSFLQQPVGPAMYAKADTSRPKQGVEDMSELLAHPSLSFSLGTPDNSNSVFPFSGDIIEGREQSKVPSFPQGQKARHITPKPSKNGHCLSSETNKWLASEARTARPPAEVHGRPQLLPRYWPKITDKELRQLSGDLNSTILPLFEKVLSASDAGRIGRLVLPKACAEAYFPTISQSEGVPIKIQDVKGKEWTFQFRFWPNNNSRMYVLEGVTPCIQNMQLQAGDTVMFSRIDPGGNLVMGFRKATSNTDIQDAQTYTIPNGGFPGETSDSGVNDDLPIHGAMTNEDSLLQSTPILEKKKKKTRNIASKNKRLLMHSEDAMMLRITREEAQELFRPPPTVKPTIVVIEDHDFEEYYEPPIFGKRTIFTAQPSGEQEQWAQCDCCSKWRKLPVDALLPPKWTCLDNIWDLKRCSCSEPEEIKPKVTMDSILQVGKELKKQRTAEKNKVAQECEPSGLDALATAAVLGENVGDSIEFSVGATTTKHPRHRPGCSCIVCIQPPSGKGRHKRTCVCNVCLTVKRRFKTLMLRKKKRQSEREAELVLGKGKLPATNGSGTDTAYGQAFPLPFMNQLEDERSQREIQTEEMPGCSNGQLDLNCDPDSEDDMLTEAAGMSISSLLHAAGLPLESLEMYFRQGGLASFGPGQATCNGEGQPSIEGCLAATNGEQENKGGEV